MQFKSILAAFLTARLAIANPYLLSRKADQLVPPAPGDNPTTAALSKFSLQFDGHVKEFADQRTALSGASDATTQAKVSADISLSFQTTARELLEYTVKLQSQVCTAIRTAGEKSAEDTSKKLSATMKMQTDIYNTMQKEVAKMVDGLKQQTAKLTASERAAITAAINAVSSAVVGAATPFIEYSLAAASIINYSFKGVLTDLFDAAHDFRSAASLTWDQPVVARSPPMMALTTSGDVEAEVSVVFED